MKDELKEELEKIDRMTGFERLRYIGELAKFYQQIDMYSEDSFKGLLDKLIRATKGY